MFVVVEINWIRKGKLLWYTYLIQPNIARVNTNDIMTTNSKNKSQVIVTKKFELPDVFHIIRIQRSYMKFKKLKKQALPENINVYNSYLENKRKYFKSCCSTEFC